MLAMRQNPNKVAKHIKSMGEEIRGQLKDRDGRLPMDVMEMLEKSKAGIMEEFHLKIAAIREMQESIKKG